jgi:hypothetical protein
MWCGHPSGRDRGIERPDGEPRVGDRRGRQEAPRVDPGAGTSPMAHRSSDAQRSANLVEGAPPEGQPHSASSVSRRRELNGLRFCSTLL